MRTNDLMDIGLSEKEAAVYLALLELGSDTVQNIAKKSGVNRATTYVILDSLKKKGVVSTVEKGTKTHFQAESPDTLRKLIRFQEAEIKEHDAKLADMLPELKGLFNLAENKPVVRFYEGKDGIRQIVTDIMKTTSGEILNVFNDDIITKTFSDQERAQVFKTRIERKIKTRNIYTSDVLREKSKELGEWYRVPKNAFSFPGDITIYGDKVALSSLKDSLSGVIIESSSITQTLRSLFYLAMETAKRYVQT